MQSVMKKNFSEVPKANITRSRFNLSHAHKSCMDAGQLIPILVQEALPGDTFVCKTSILGRLATPLKPVMDNMFLDMHYFAVPNRLLWDNWEKFCGAQDNPGDSIAFTIPQIVAPAGGWLVNSLADYFGLPTEVADLSTSSLWHRAYNLIWNEWFRDENIQNSKVVDKDNGPDTVTDYVILNRGKRHDYFTSCLPWPQKGTGISISLTGDAPVTGIGKRTQVFPEAADRPAYETDGVGTVLYANSALITGSGINENYYGEQDPNNAGFPNIRADLSGVSAIDLNDLRDSLAIQRLLERDARGGTRYQELIKNHFQVTGSDQRLQRPEYLGGNTSRIIINQVPQTGESGTTPQGHLTAFGEVRSQGNGFVKSFSEHSVIIGLASVRADLTYQKGVPKMFSRLTRYDFYWPEFAALGEQAVLNKEIYFQNTSVDDDVFGYQERWSEYRHAQSKITNIFRSNYATSLDAWHLSQEFTSLPTLSDTFIKDNPPIDRVIAVPSEPHLLMDSFFNLTVTRAMPVYSIPNITTRL